MQAHRYAIYLAPAEPFRTLGAQWLGRCPDKGLDAGALVSAPIPVPDDPRRKAWVGAPAHYGLHATLKPPFRLAEGTDATMLDAAARAFAHGRPAFDVPLALRALRGFIAWCLAEHPHGRQQMHALADDAVRAFERFRAPATPEEIARRNPARLGDAQRDMLARWGYPYLFETFVFHITLTGMVPEPELRDAMSLLERLAAPLRDVPLHVDSIAVFVQPARGEDFLVARHYGFDGSVTDGAGAAYMAP
ncbi:DUF1045 domain-containing protein [Cupriavidus plantarum]|uniref:DUF1045 domain-containing protein n=1 Tax=Cupriavidus plantarum TaxID=942865 RepID=UPI00339D545F